MGEGMAPQIAPVFRSARKKLVARGKIVPIFHLNWHLYYARRASLPQLTFRLAPPLPACRINLKYKCCRIYYDVIRIHRDLACYCSRILKLLAPNKVKKTAFLARYASAGRVTGDASPRKLEQNAGCWHLGKRRRVGPTGTQATWRPRNPREAHDAAATPGLPSAGGSRPVDRDGGTPTARGCV